MAIRSGPVASAGTGRNPGFTLLEILVALGVLSIASMILISLYTSSLAFAQSSRSHKAAAGIAEEQLYRLKDTPEDFVWPLAEMTPGEPAELTLRDKEAGPYPAEEPRTLALNPSAARREANFYGKFSWRAYAVLPSEDAPYVNVVVTVGWEPTDDAARGPQSVTLTSAVPRARVEGLS